jgi:hypothetical protein
MKPLLLIIPLLLLMSCRKQDLVDEKTFVDCYARILIIKSSTADSAAASAQVDSVLAQNRITKDLMQRQLAMYVEDGNRYGKVLEEINVKLRALDSLAKMP